MKILPTLLVSGSFALSAIYIYKYVYNNNNINIEFVNNVAEKNVYMTIANIREQSPVLEEMEKQGEIKIVGAMYDIKDGSVTFYE